MKQWHNAFYVCSQNILCLLTCWKIHLILKCWAFRKSLFYSFVCLRCIILAIPQWLLANFTDWNVTKIMSFRNRRPLSITLCIFNCVVQAPQDGLGWGDRSEWSDTCSTRWIRDTRVGRTRRGTCAGAGSPLRRRSSRSQRHSPIGRQRDADEVTAQWSALCCCGEPSRSCCSDRAPRKQSFSQSTHA